MTAIPAAKPGPNVRARFYKEGNTVWLEETVVASKDSLAMKARPEHIQKWPREYEAFTQGQDEVDVGGIPLTEVPGITRELAKQYKLKGVRNAEELAALTDAGCSALGTGALTARKAAQNLLKAMQADVLQKQLDDAKKKHKAA